MRTILPTAYWGDIRYYTHLLGTDSVIDLHEHYVKQSCRNRCTLLTANGPTQLVVPVLQPSGIKTATRDIRIDYTKHWQHQHWQTIVSSYRNAAYFDHYADRLEALYAHRYERLVELNLAAQQTAYDILHLTPQATIAEAYVEPRADDCDLRNALSTKPRLARTDPHFVPESYYQVFADRMEFVSNLSILDLILCEGPDAVEILRRSVRP